MSHPKAARSYPGNVFRSTTPDESQDLDGSIKFHHIFKVPEGSHFYERILPDDQGRTLRIDGPSDGAFALDDKGNIRILTGIRDPEIGAGSGRLGIKTWGQQQLHNERSNIQYCSGGDEEGIALNILAYGDVVEEARGSERVIRAQKISIIADEELTLIGNSGVFIQAGSEGGGTITMNAGSVEKQTTNDKEKISGQKMTYGVSEETTINFDPRASVNVVSPGHVNWKILGDYQQWVGGVVNQVAAGGVSTPPLIEDRTSAYKVQTLAGNTDITSAAQVNITGVGNVNIRGALIFLN